MHETDHRDQHNLPQRAEAPQQGRMGQAEAALHVSETPSEDAILADKHGQTPTEHTQDY